MIVTAFVQTIENLREDYSAVLSGILMTSFSLVILGTFILVYLNLIHLTQLAFRKSHYSIFLTEPISNPDKQKIASFIKSLPDVGALEEISSAEAKKQLIESFNEAQEIFKKIDFPKFPNIIEFVLDRSGPLSTDELSQLQAMPGVQDVITGRETRDQINTFFNIANFVGLFLIILLIVCVVLIIYNTIHIGIRMRSKEIEILKILGAPARFIKWPFLMEGMLIAVVSYFLSLGIIYFLYSFVIAGITFNKATYSIRAIVRFFSPLEMGNLFLTFILLGLCSALLATNKIIKHLDV
ncbi:permease-like cell division protein FtsX [bacterium]|nr:permease-like cell division protein FtsX [bacterium]